MTPPGHPRCILMTTDTVGGVWNYALELCRGLGGHGVAVVLATMGPAPREDQRAEVARLGHVTLCESTFRLEWMDEPWDDVARAGEWLLGLERRFRPDVVHLNGFAHGALPWSAPALVVGHSCVLSWWRAVRGGEAPAEWQRYRAAVADGLAGAQMIIAPSRAMLRALQEHYGQGDFSRATRFENALVIPNGRNAADFTSTADKEPFVLSVGRLWDEAKNAQALAAIAPQLGWPVCVAGDTAAPNGAPCALPNVRSLGRCDARTLAGHYACAAIYALPARYEPFGLSALEAALSGCALVLGDIPSLRELWEGAAIFVPPNDHDALRDGINALIHDAPCRSRVAARARMRAANFSAHQMTERYLETYRRLIVPDGCSANAPLPIERNRAPLQVA
jgi:glycogen synthase